MSMLLCVCCTGCFTLFVSNSNVDCKLFCDAPLCMTSAYVFLVPELSRFLNDLCLPPSLWLLYVQYVVFSVVSDQDGNHKFQKLFLVKCVLFENNSGSYLAD